MTSPRVWKRGHVKVTTGFGLVMVAAVMSASLPARADVVFRKKPPATSTDDSAGEAAPSGGEPGADTAAPDKSTYAPQSDDKDYPERQAEKDKAEADAALARQMKKAQQDRERERGTPIYDKWEFWAVTGAVVVGAVLAIWGGSAVAHQINGGDIKGCPMTASDGCFGQGR